MNKNLAAISAVSLSLISAGLASAQNTKQDLFSGLGRSTLPAGLIDADAVTGQAANLGVVVAGNEIFVSARGNAGGAVAPHSCFVLDFNGNLLRSFGQSIHADTSVWGWRDGAVDFNPATPTLMFGYDDPALLQGRIDFVDINGNPATSVLALNGPQVLGGPNFDPATGTLTPVFTGTALATCRGIMFDPEGNGNNGSILTADFGSDIVELDLNGNEIGRIPNNGAWSIYGIARNPLFGSNKFWVNSSPNGVTGRIVEVDRVTGLETGAGFDFFEGIQGGLSVVDGGLDGRNAGFDLISLTQGTPDTIQGHRVDLYNGVDGTNKVDLRVGLDGGAMSLARQLTISNANTSWDLDLDDGSATPRPLDIAAFAINLPPFSAPNGEVPAPVLSLLPSLREVRFTDTFTSPAGVALYVNTTEAAGPLSLAVPPIIALFAASDTVRVQGLYADLNVPVTAGPQIMFTNQTRALVDTTPPLNVTFAANGANPFNADTTSGFWSLTNNGSFEVLSLEVILPGTGVFDIDQTGMADIFWNGNSTAAACSGTYRNGTEVSTDLIFAGTLQSSACDATALGGFLHPATNTLQFAFADGSGPNGGFTNGEIFEWDTDVDGGGLTDAASMVGTTVTVSVRDPLSGTVYTTSRLLTTPGPAQAIATF